MKELILDPGIVSVCIEGRIFPFRADSAFAARVAALAAEASERAEEAKENGSHAPESVSAFLTRCVDTLLGEGTVARIFVGRTPEVLDLCDVLGAVTDAFHDYRARRLRRLRRGEGSR